jgi:outer membrane protein OmpA-like peptidoglycan-associated protein
MLAAGSTACASKKFVRTSVGEVNDKVDSMGRSLEETQERTRKNEGRIGEVDQKAQQAQSSADQANSAAGQARQEATAARSEANTKFDAIDKTNKRLVYEVVLSEDSGNFKFGKTLLPDEAKSKLDQMVAQLKQDPKNVFIEIEGHT